MIGWIVAGILGFALAVSLTYNITGLRNLEAKMQEIIEAAIAKIKAGG